MPPIRQAELANRYSHAAAPFASTHNPDCVLAAGLLVSVAEALVLSADATTLFAWLLGVVPFAMRSFAGVQHVVMTAG